MPKGPTERKLFTEPIEGYPGFVLKGDIYYLNNHHGKYYVLNVMPWKIDGHGFESCLPMTQGKSFKVMENVKAFSRKTLDAIVIQPANLEILKAAVLKKFVPF